MKLQSLLVGAAVLAPLAFTGVANASPIAYGTIRAGVAEGTVSFSGGSLDSQQGNDIGAAVGSHVGPFRVELGVDSMTADLFPGVEGNVISYSATAYLDSPIKIGPVTPFIGIGGDYRKAKANFGFGHVDSGYNTGWHWDAGASAPINDHWDIEVMRRESHGAIDIAGASPDVETTAWMLGLRRNF